MVSTITSKLNKRIPKCSCVEKPENPFLMVMLRMLGIVSYSLVYTVLLISFPTGCFQFGIMNDKVAKGPN